MFKMVVFLTEQVMYWGDAQLDKVEKANLDGSGRTLILTETPAHYFAFSLSPDYIYFTDWQYV